MLILARRPGESLMIGDDVKITILRVSGGQASIGIEAPRKVDVHRQEIYERIQNEQKTGGAITGSVFYD